MPGGPGPTVGRLGEIVRDRGHGRGGGVGDELRRSVRRWTPADALAEMKLWLEVGRIPISLCSKVRHVNIPLQATCLPSMNLETCLRIC